MNPSDQQTPMDWKRLALFFLGSLAILVGWPLLFPSEPAPSPPPEPPPAASASAAPGLQPAPSAADQIEPAAPAAAAEAIGEDTARRVVVEVHDARITFTNVGGRVASWRLLDEGEYGDPATPLDLVQHAVPEHSDTKETADLSPDGTPRALPPVSDDAAFLPLQVMTDDLELDRRLAQARHRVEVEEVAGETVVHLQWSDGAGTSVRKTLTFHDDWPVVTIEAHVTVNGQPIPFHVGWGPGICNHTVREHRNTYFIRGRAHWMAGSKTETAPSPEKAADLPAASVRWAALEDSFFAVVVLPVVPGNPDANVLSRGFRLTGVLPPRENGKPGKSSDWPEHLVLAAPFSAQSPYQTIYVGPRDRETLKALSAGLPGGLGVEHLTDLGFVEPIAALLHWLLLWLHQHTQSWGISILLLTLIIRGAIFPLTQYSLKKTRGMQEKMGVVKPKLDALKTRFRKLPRTVENRQREQQEMMALYQSAGINPADQLMGCLPLLLSMPFFFALFRLLPQATEFRHEPFLGWHDLSAADPTHILPVLTGLTMWFSSRLSMSSATNVDPMQKNMLYVFPLMFLWFTWSAPLGLVVYWTASNVIQIGQQYLLKISAPSPDGDGPGHQRDRKAGSGGRGRGASPATGDPSEKPSAGPAGKNASPRAKRRKR